jgi:hypothetical protein
MPKIKGLLEWHEPESLAEKANSAVKSAYELNKVEIIDNVER